MKVKLYKKEYLQKLILKEMYFWFFWRRKDIEDKYVFYDCTEKEHINETKKYFQAFYKVCKGKLDQNNEELMRFVKNEYSAFIINRVE